MTANVTDVSCHAPDAGDAALLSGRTAVAGAIPVVAIVGRPNVGKSTFFAQASGRYAEAANVPGTTVGIARRQVRSDGRSAILVDLPGTLTLCDRSDGLPLFWGLLAEVRPDAIIVIVDAGDLARHLPLALACRDLGLPLVVAANLADEAKARGIEFDLGRLLQLLAVPVRRTIGRRGTGVGAVVNAAVRLAEARRAAGRSGSRSVRPAVPYGPENVRRVVALAGELAGSGPERAPDTPRSWWSPVGSPLSVQQLSPLPRYSNQSVGRLLSAGHATLSDVTRLRRGCRTGWHVSPPLLGRGCPRSS